MNTPGWQADVPWVGVNQLGIIVAINEPFTEQLGWSPAELVGQPLQMLVPPLYRDAHNHGLARFIGFEKPAILGQPIDVPCLRPDGQSVRVELQLYADKQDGEWMFGALMCPAEAPGGGGR